METTIGRLLYLTHRTVHEELDRRLSQHGASLWNWVLLKEAANAEGASQRELAQHMGIEPPTLVRQLEQWEMPLIDCQMSTAHLASLGAREIRRAQFLTDVQRLVRLPPVPSPWVLDDRRPERR